jgi:hypothetical protein
MVRVAKLFFPARIDWSVYMHIVRASRSDCSPPAVDLAAMHATLYWYAAVVDVRWLGHVTTTIAVHL